LSAFRVLRSRNQNHAQLAFLLLAILQARSWFYICPLCIFPFCSAVWEMGTKQSAPSGEGEWLPCHGSPDSGVDAISNNKPRVRLLLRIKQPCVYHSVPETLLVWKKERCVLGVRSVIYKSMDSWVVHYNVGGHAPDSSPILAPTASRRGRLSVGQLRFHPQITRNSHVCQGCLVLLRLDRTLRLCSGIGYRFHQGEEERAQLTIVVGSTEKGCGAEVRETAPKETAVGLGGTQLTYYFT